MWLARGPSLVSLQKTDKLAYHLPLPKSDPQLSKIMPPLKSHSDLTSTPLLLSFSSMILTSLYLLYIYISPVVKKILLISYWNYYDKHSLNFFQIECTFKKSEHISPLEILVHLVCTFLGISEWRVTEYVL